MYVVSIVVEYETAEGEILKALQRHTLFSHPVANDKYDSIETAKWQASVIANRFDRCFTGRSTPAV